MGYYHVCVLGDHHVQQLVSLYLSVEISRAADAYASSLRAAAGRTARDDRSLCSLFRSLC